MDRKPKTQKEKILQVVEKVMEGETIIFRCAVDIDSPKKCDYAPKKFVAGNYKRDFQKAHPDVLKELELDDDDEEVPPQKKQKVSAPGQKM